METTRASPPNNTCKKYDEYPQCPFSEDNGIPSVETPTSCEYLRYKKYCPHYDDIILNRREQKREQKTQEPRKKLFGIF